MPRGGREGRPLDELMEGSVASTDSKGEAKGGQGLGGRGGECAHYPGDTFRSRRVSREYGTGCDHLALSGEGIRNSRLERGLSHHRIEVTYDSLTYKSAKDPLVYTAHQQYLPCC